MNKGSITLKVSLIPIILLLALIGGAGYLLMKGEIKIPWIRNDNTIEVRRLEGFPAIVPGGNLTDKMRVVIKSQEELENFLKSVDPSGNLALGEKIDFDNEYILGAASKTQPKGGYEIRVKKVYVDKQDKSLLVSIRQVQPGDNCITTDATNTPVDLVAINKTDQKIEFDLIKDIKDCEREEAQTEAPSDVEGTSTENVTNAQ